jgi:hypothetical protein
LLGFVPCSTFLPPRTKVKKICAEFFPDEGGENESEFDGDEEDGEGSE